MVVLLVGVVEFVRSADDVAVAMSVALYDGGWRCVAGPVASLLAIMRVGGECKTIVS